MRENEFPDSATPSKGNQEKGTDANREKLSLYQFI